VLVDHGVEVVEAVGERNDLEVGEDLAELLVVAMQVAKDRY
jgi:hypothetical protein